MLKTIFTATLLVAGISQANPYNVCPMNTLPTPIIVDVAWERMARFQNTYTDFYNRCGSMIGDLQRAEVVAQQLFYSSGKGAAADKLISTLVQKAATLPSEKYDVAYPITIESIRQGAEIAKTLVKSTQGDRSMPARMAAQIKYNTAVNLYRIIKKAYRKLDAPYYLQVNRQCYGNCVGIGMRDQFNEYADGIVDLAKEFIQLQIGSGQAQGTDWVQLSMTGATAKAAKRVVMNSVFRRDFSCAIMELHSIQVEAESFVCHGNPGYNSSYFTESLNQRLSSVDFPAHGCGYGPHYGSGYRRHGGWVSNSSDRDVDVNVNVSVDVDEE